jgi:hypothetical protein
MDKSSIIIEVRERGGSFKVKYWIKFMLLPCFITPEEKARLLAGELVYTQCSIYQTVLPEDKAYETHISNQRAVNQGC